MEMKKNINDNVPKTKKVAPDGGWAWMVSLGTGLIYFSTRSLEPSFGLLFNDLLEELGVKTTGASFIASTLDSVVNFSGFFVGPVLKAFSYRKVCAIGATICAFGLLFTAPAKSMAHILTTYSIMGGFGVGLASASSYVALNHYFTKKRGQAVGFALTGAGIGLMVMPQLVKLLLAEYGFRWSVVILAGVGFHSVLGAVLLQPVKWHLKEVPADCEVPDDKETECKKENDEDEKEEKSEINPLVVDQSMKKPKLTTQRSLVTFNNNSMRNIGLSRAQTSDRPLQDVEKNSYAKLYPELASSGNISEARKRKMSAISNLSHMDLTGSYLQMYIDVKANDIEEEEPQNKSLSEKAVKKGFLRTFIDLMDFDLLKDLSFVNLLLGLALFWSGELQFRMLMPFFIRSLGYNMNDAAFCLSIAAVTEIIVKIILPPIFDKTKIPKKMLFFVSAFLLAVTRTVLAVQTEWTPLLIWLSICGVFRGLCLSNYSLPIVEYCPLDKLPAAYGLHMVSKGILVVLIGPIIGYVRDYTNSFSMCIHVQNALIMSCVIVWGIEYLCYHLQSKKKNIDIIQEAPGKGWQ